MLILLALLAPRARAEDEVFSIDKLLTPYTIFVVRIDLVAADPGNLQQWANARIKATKLEKEDEQKLVAQLDASLASFKQLRAAGAKEVWVLLDLRIAKPVGAAVTQLGAGPPVVMMCVPVGNGVDAEKVEALLGKSAPRHAGAIIAGAAQDLAALNQRIVKPRRDLFDALALRKASAVTFVLGFGDPELRRILGTAVPRVAVGPSSLDELIGKTDSIAWSLDSLTPQGPQFGKLIVRTSAAADAGPVAEGIDAARQLLKQQLPPAAGDAFGQLLERGKPAVQGNTVAVDLAWGPADFERLSPVLVSSIANTRKAAERAKSASNIRQLLLHGHLAASKNKDEWPATLDELIKQGEVEAPTAKSILANPRSTTVSAGYVYQKPPKDDAVPRDQRIVIYELLPAGTDEIFVGFADGRCTLMKADSLNAKLVEQKRPKLRVIGE